jgi:uncharacterized protein involved in exopolysaccharide biosynthesis
MLMRSHAEDETSRENWPSIFELVLRNRRSLVAWMFVCLAVGIAYVYVAQARYTAIAQLVVDARQSTRLRSDTSPEPLIDVAVIDSQLEIVKSERVALAVIRKLDLSEDAEFNSGGVGTSIRKLLRLDDDQNREKVEQTLAQFGVLSFFERLLRPSNVGDTEKLQRTLARFRRALNVKRLGRSYVLDIEFTSTDPDKAAHIANAVGRAYIEDQLDARAAQTGEMTAWLDGRVKTLREQMSNAFLKAELSKSDVAAASRDGQVKSRELDAEARAYKAVHDAFLDRYVQAIQLQSSPMTEARIVSEPISPLQPSSPRLGFVLLLSLAGGLGLGLFTSFVRELRRRGGGRRPDVLVAVRGVDFGSSRQAKADDPTRVHS